MARKVFVDSDVIISSLISQTGAAYFLIHNVNLELFVSNVSIKELEIVISRLNIDSLSLSELIKTHFKRVQFTEPLEKLTTDYSDYSIDPDDTHIVAGAKKANAGFLISYNVRHFNAEKMKQDFGIMLTTPANFFQYLRSSQ